MQNKRKVICLILCVSLLFSIFTFYNGGICTVAAGESQTYTGYITGDAVNVRSDASTSAKSVGKVNKFTLFTSDGTKKDSSGKVWYKIKTLASSSVSGYVIKDYVKITATSYFADSFSDQLANFPQSYKSYLNALHKKYPKWIFVADKLTASFDNILSAEYTNVFTKEVEAIKKESWRSMQSGAYDWQLGIYHTDNGNWYSASKEAIAAYIDPRNFLNENDIYMFLKQQYDSVTQTKEGLRTVIASSFLANGYGGNKDAYINDIMEAAKQSGVSPYVIAGTIMVEQGNGTSSLISGTYGKYKGYYNFFNFGASGSTNTAVVTSGLEFARKNGWNTRRAAIIGGAKLYVDGYLNVGQDTYFYKDYNVMFAYDYFKASKSLHQYAQSVYDACVNASRMKDTYSANKNSALVFRIPVYSSIPDKVSQIPAVSDKKNNYYITDMVASGISPAFDKFCFDYKLSVSGNTNIKISLQKGASLASSSSIKLLAGANTVKINIKSETGYINTYTINVTAKKGCTLTLNNQDKITEISYGKKGDVNGDRVIDVIDLAVVRLYLLKLKTLSKEALSYGDINSDKVVDVIDLAAMRMHLLGVKIIDA